MCQILPRFLFRRNVVGEACQSKRQLTFIFNSESNSASPLFLHSHSYHDYLEHLDESHTVGKSHITCQVMVRLSYSDNILVITLTTHFPKREMID